MILRRLGRKTKLADKLIALMPAHNTYFEPFFGTGAIFFKKPLANYNYLNDSDDDVYNLSNVLVNEKEALYQRILDTPYHKSQFEYFRKTKGLTGLDKAMQFLFLSNYSYLGKADCLVFCKGNMKEQLLKDIHSNLIDKLRFAKLNNSDFRKFFTDFSLENDRGERNTFVYSDPPYVLTTDNYKHSFKEQDARDLLDILTSTKWKFMYSEFKSDLTLQLAKDYNLQVTEISERCTLKSRNTEIIMTNYDTNQGLF